LKLKNNGYILKWTTAIFLLILSFTACRKYDSILPNINQSTDKQIIEQFTKTPKNLNQLLQKIADKLKEKDAQTPFIINLGNKVGVPLWGKAQFTLKHTSNAAAREIGEGEQMVLIPLSVPNSNEVDGFIAAIINANNDVVDIS